MSRILLVDDDGEILVAYGHLLSRLGHEVETAPDGREALARVAARPFDAIVTDLTMPELDGVAFLREVRARDLDVPVILVTGTPDLASAVQALEHGAFRYLTKPVDPAALADALAKALRLHQLLRLKREALAILGDEGRALGDRASLDARFAVALAGVRTAFQPIVSRRDRRVVAYEALLRTDEPTLARPDHFLAAAERLGRVHELGRVARAEAARAFAAGAPPGVRLFVNLHPTDLNDESLFDPRGPLALLGDRVVLEITERASLEGTKDVRAVAARLRALGFRLAVDDLGAGYAGLTALAQIEPEVMKIDMSLARAVHESAAKQRVIGSMIRLGREMGAEVVVEGVETEPERDALRDLGCDLLQGFLFARPTFAFEVPPDHLLG